MKRKTLVAIIIFIAMSTLSWAQNNPKLYKIFDKKGKSIHWKKVLRKSAKAETVFFGEYHDDPVIHYLQLQLLKHLIESEENLALGLEMFEWQDAEVLNAYLSSKIDQNTFFSEANSIWKNYKTDYSPMVELAKRKGISVFASNVPRAWASAVYRGGFEALDTIESDLKKYVPPLPIPYDAELPGYRNMLKMAHGHGGENLPKAQALKDAAMAWSVVQLLEKGFKILHLNGTYHTNNFEGIIWYLEKYRPKTRYFTIAMVRQANIQKLNKEFRGLADVVIAVPDDMIRTH
ncbi:MAG: ChaN family lipoprotein [Thermaurantimonas sp.]|uniref:ChaN family lipoprotein n=1 Tax=Thermaurantimonas sp. TaxID=2681568 RepID=UPI00391B7432